MQVDPAGSLESHGKKSYDDRLQIRAEVSNQGSHETAMHVGNTFEPYDEATQHPEAVRSMFNRIARRYDLANHLFSMGLDLAWRRWIVRHYPAEPNSRILDTCCGTGDSCLGYGNRPDITVLGLDFSRPMLVLGRLKDHHRRSKPVYPIYWVEGDSQQLPLHTGSIDRITIAFGLRNLAQFDSAIREFHRVLAPHGQLIILEFTVPVRSWWRRFYLIYLNRVLPFLGGWLTGNRSAYDYLARTIQVFPHYDALVDHIVPFGFVAIELHPFCGGIAACYVLRKLTGPSGRQR